VRRELAFQDLGAGPVLSALPQKRYTRKKEEEATSQSPFSLPLS